jgi:hypothetical protein
MNLHLDPTILGMLENMFQRRGCPWRTEAVVSASDYFRAVVLRNGHWRRRRFHLRHRESRYTPRKASWGYRPWHLHRILSIRRYSRTGILAWREEAKGSWSPKTRRVRIKENKIVKLSITESWCEPSKIVLRSNFMCSFALYMRGWPSARGGSTVGYSNMTNKNLNIYGILGFWGDMPLLFPLWLYF